MSSFAILMFISSLVPTGGGGLKNWYEMFSVDLRYMVTLASKCFECQFLATWYERGQGIPIGGDKRGGGEGKGILM